MIICVGGKYITRKGSKVLIIKKIDADYGDYIFEGREGLTDWRKLTEGTTRTWRIDGGHSTPDNPLDIVKEYHKQKSLYEIL